MTHEPKHELVLDHLAEAYIAASVMIRVEHARDGRHCEDRDDDPVHLRLHETMREISRTILLYVDNVVEVPEIRDYLALPWPIEEEA
jgi:hypothetical protein